MSATEDGVLVGPPLVEAGRGARLPSGVRGHDGCDDLRGEVAAARGVAPASGLGDPAGVQELVELPEDSGGVAVGEVHLSASAGRRAAASERVGEAHLFASVLGGVEVAVPDEGLNGRVAGGGEAGEQGSVGGRAGVGGEAEVLAGSSRGWAGLDLGCGGEVIPVSRQRRPWRKQVRTLWDEPSKSTLRRRGPATCGLPKSKYRRAEGKRVARESKP